MDPASPMLDDACSRAPTGTLAPVRANNLAEAMGASGFRVASTDAPVASCLAPGWRLDGDGRLRLVSAEGSVRGSGRTPLDATGFEATESHQHLDQQPDEAAGDVWARALIIAAAGIRSASLLGASQPVVGIVTYSGGEHPGASVRWHLRRESEPGWLVPGSLEGYGDEAVMELELADLP